MIDQSVKRLQDRAEEALDGYFLLLPSRIYISRGRLVGHIARQDVDDNSVHLIYSSGKFHERRFYNPDTGEVLHTDEWHIRIEKSDGRKTVKREINIDEIDEANQFIDAWIAYINRNVVYNPHWDKIVISAIENGWHP